MIDYFWICCEKPNPDLAGFFFSATMKNLFAVLLVILVFREDVLGRSVDKNKDKDKKDKDKKDKDKKDDKDDKKDKEEKKDKEDKK